MPPNPVNTVDIKVGAVIRNWMLATTGSDYLRLSKGTNLWAIIKQQLALLPKDYTAPSDRSEYITVELLDCSGPSMKYFNYPSDKEVEINYIYRCYVNESGAASIRKYFENQFRNTFLVYMSGRMADQKGDHNISRAITDFLTDYSITVERRLFNRLTKYWYRYRLKNEAKLPIPIFF